MRKFLFLTFFIISLSAFSQSIQETNTDSIYYKALELYKNQSFQQSLNYTNRGLELAPEYHDIRVLRVRDHWALENYQEATSDIEYLLENAENYPGVIQLAERHTRYLKDSKEALAFLNSLESKKELGLKLKVLKTQLLLQNKQRKESRTLALDIFNEKELDDDDRYILQNVLKRTVSNEVGVTYQYIHFSEDYNKDDWQTISPEFQHNFNRTAVIARVNYTDRSYDDGILYELEAYPVFSDRVYSFVNIGVSDGTVFPDMRASASLFVNFLRKFEFEGGARLLHFSDQDYLTGIAGLTMYAGKFYLNGRAFIGPERNNKVIQNYQANVRYYFRNIDNYLFVRLGTGISPDERTIFTQVQENPGLEAYYGNIGINKSFNNNHIFQLLVGYLYEDINNNTQGNQLVGSVGYRFRF